MHALGVECGGVAGESTWQKCQTPQLGFKAVICRRISIEQAPYIQINKFRPNSHRVHRRHDHFMERSCLEISKRRHLRLPRLPVQLLGVDVVVVHRSARRKLSLPKYRSKSIRQRACGKWAVVFPGLLHVCRPAASRAPSQVLKCCRHVAAISIHGRSHLRQQPGIKVLVWPRRVLPHTMEKAKSWCIQWMRGYNVL